MSDLDPTPQQIAGRQSALARRRRTALQLADAKRVAEEHDPARFTTGQSVRHIESGLVLVVKRVTDRYLVAENETDVKILPSSCFEAAGRHADGRTTDAGHDPNRFKVGQQVRHIATGAVLTVKQVSTSLLSAENREKVILFVFQSSAFEPVE